MKNSARIQFTSCCAALTMLAAQPVLATEHFVNMTSLFTFNPAALEIDVADTVTWVNQDAEDHDVASDTGDWTTFVVPPDESASLIFNSAGVFPYRDSLYGPAGMTGSITVKDVVTPTLSAPVRPNNGQFQFTISGTAGQTYIIETSSNLTHWVAVDTNVAPSNVFNYTNTSATNLTQFYRVKREP
jgi:plastocyanin